jgi:hypothetical protein
MKACITFWITGAVFAVAVINFITFTLWHNWQISNFLWAASTLLLVTKNLIEKIYEMKGK